MSSKQPAVLRILMTWQALAACAIFFSPFIISPLFAEEPPASSDHAKEHPYAKEEAVSTTHSIKIGGTDTPYTATIGTQLLCDDKCIAKASISYIAYTKDGVSDLRNRPITFCFNGGPGSSSVWLHLGCLGPRRIGIDKEGKMAVQPYRLLDNPYSMLDQTDLVFIDPVSTGYSRAVEDPKQYHGVEGDIKSVAEFIRLYLTRNGRWESPKFLAGESYGTTRAAGLALELHDTHYIYLDGIIMVSTELNYQTVVFGSGNDLPYTLFLPTYATTALYYKKLAPELQQDPVKTRKEVEQFALGEYTQALMLGNKIGKEQRKAVIEKLSRYTGLTEEYLDRADLRVEMFRFAKELLRGEKRVVGRFDARVTGVDMDPCGVYLLFDPSFENVLGVFTATFNSYVRQELNWKQDAEYKILTPIHPWDFGKATNQYLNVSDQLVEVMSKNPNLKVFVASGYNDLATPYFSTDYTFTHLGLDPSLEGNIVMKTYAGGHMMYLYEPTLLEMRKDMVQFYRDRLGREQNPN